MKKMQFKPLILLLPLAVILAAMFLIELTLGEFSAKSEAASGNNEISLITSDDFEEYTFVVGQTGSLEGGYEPIYSDPSDKSEEIAQLQYNCVVMPSKEQKHDGWIHVDLFDKGDGYVKKDKVKVDTVQIGSSNDIRKEIINNAFEYLGLRFVRYGGSLKDGIDCTNFVSQIFEMSGIELPNTPEGINNSGRQIKESEMQPGDLIYYYEANNGNGHVGIYIGGNYIINSAGHAGKTYPEGGVRICCLTYEDRDCYYPIQIVNAGGK